MRPFFWCALHGRRRGGASPLYAWRRGVLAQGTGVRREAESEGIRQQRPDLMNRNRISGDLRLICRYLTCGVMENGVKRAVTEGTPQGGPLSLILSNIVLDELDKELERRKLRFVRYADNISIFVGSQMAAERILENVVSWIECRLKLRVNYEKSGIVAHRKGRYWDLGFSTHRGNTSWGK